jgi:hypothetical protein
MAALDLAVATRQNAANDHNSAVISVSAFFTSLASLANARSEPVTYLTPTITLCG